MNAILERLKMAIGRRSTRQMLQHLAVSVGLVFAIAVTGAVGYLVRFNLTGIALVYLVFVVLISLRWGLVQASVASVAAVLCMNYLFIPPIFEFQIADPENWISIAVFETAALVVSGLSSKVIQHAKQTEVQRQRTEILYELSRAILLIDSRRSTGEQLSALVCEFVHVERVDFWVIYDAHSVPSDRATRTWEDVPEEVYISGIESEDIAARVTRRLLRIGTTPIGALILGGWEHDGLLADAVASLSAIAFERTRAIQKENRAEAERNTEQLRTAVLDGLAHGFKTPLTAIQTASSGLLTIDRLTATQLELVSIIDEQATMLSQMTTRLLQTAALESRDVRLHRIRTSIAPFVEELLSIQSETVRSRIKIRAVPGLIPIDLDPQLMQLAVLQLMDNAAKYSTVGQGIDLLLQQDDRETTVTVINQGLPIQMEDRERIFERFYRGMNASHGPSGTGLGLSIVKKTAEAHGGRAWVECEGDTTRFCFTVENYRRG